MLVEMNLSKSSRAIHFSTVERSKRISCDIYHTFSTGNDISGFCTFVFSRQDYFVPSVNVVLFHFSYFFLLKLIKLPLTTANTPTVGTLVKRRSANFFSNVSRLAFPLAFPENYAMRNCTFIHGRKMSCET